MTKPKMDVVRTNVLGAATKESKDSRPVRRDVVARWGGDDRIVADGFVGVPVLFLERMAVLKPHAFTPAEAMFVICVMAFKWDARKPYPSYKRIATWMGKSESYARRLAQQLETKGFLRRVARIGTTNAFDFEPLFEKLLVEDPAVRSIKMKRAATSTTAGRTKNARAS